MKIADNYIVLINSKDGKQLKCLAFAAIRPSEAEEKANLWLKGQFGEYAGWETGAVLRPINGVNIAGTGG